MKDKQFKTLDEQVEIFKYKGLEIKDDQYVKDVFSDEIFNGKALDYLDDVWSSINKNAIAGIAKLRENAATLDKMNHNYADADKKSTSGIEGIQ